MNRFLFLTSVKVTSYLLDVSCEVLIVFVLFHRNYALHRESRGTVVAGTAGQQFVDNVFFNPDNDYEIVTVNRSL
jgi:hypothetical protein